MPWTVPEYLRRDEPFVGDERAILAGFLDWYRASLLVKCTGLTGAQLAERAVPPSNMSLLGLVRHLTDVVPHPVRRGADRPLVCQGRTAGRRLRGG
jgi:Protein of unknown function (DUF664)